MSCVLSLMPLTKCVQHESAEDLASLQAEFSLKIGAEFGARVVGNRCDGDIWTLHVRCLVTHVTVCAASLAPTI